MCSIVMPGDYEMLVSHSPPVFSHSPPSSYLQSRYETFPRCKPVKSSPKRPCLVIRPEDSSSSSGDEDPVSPTRLKKKVVFADDRGMSLTHVRVMTEPSNVPPVWSFRFLAQVTRGVNAEPVADRKEVWEVSFSQPASNYVKFRKELDTNKVSLENVIIKENDELVVGTVKVSNITFEKEVFLRVSEDEWKSHRDVNCSFVTNSATSSVYVLYDTFSFQIPLPQESESLEFCVCYRCEGLEFWDNNSNKNYRLAKKSSKGKSDPEIKLAIKSSDIFRAKVDSWPEFASWTHLDNNNPYW